MREEDESNIQHGWADTEDRQAKRTESYQQGNNCGSTNIDKQSGAIGVHTCNSCGSSDSISWREREVED